MNQIDIDEEARRLASKFKNVNRAEFARLHGVPGGQAMVYQHITGRRPISLEAAKAYAKGFGCPLDEISPRLAKETRAAFEISKKPPGSNEQKPKIEQLSELLDELFLLPEERDGVIAEVMRRSEHNQKVVEMGQKHKLPAPYQVLEDERSASTRSRKSKHG